jgi:hypothetical protein
MAKHREHVGCPHQAVSDKMLGIKPVLLEQSSSLAAETWCAG